MCRGECKPYSLYLMMMMMQTMLILLSSSKVIAKVHPIRLINVVEEHQVVADPWTKVNRLQASVTYIHHISINMRIN